MYIVDGMCTSGQNLQQISFGLKFDRSALKTSKKQPKKKKDLVTSKHNYFSMCSLGHECDEIIQPNLPPIC